MAQKCVYFLFAMRGLRKLQDDLPLETNSEKQLVVPMYYNYGLGDIQPTVSECHVVSSIHHAKCPFNFRPGNVTLTA